MQPMLFDKALEVFLLKFIKLQS